MKRLIKSTTELISMPFLILTIAFLLAANACAITASVIQDAGK